MSSYYLLMPPDVVEVGNQQMFSTKTQVLNIFSFVGHEVSATQPNSVVVAPKWPQI
jgi:hypothetical protein